MVLGDLIVKNIFRLKFCSNCSITEKADQSQLNGLDVWIVCPGSTCQK